MRQLFMFAPGSGSPLFSVLILALLLVLPMLIASYLLYAPHSIRYEVSPGALRIRGDVFYGRSIATRDLDLGKASVLDLGKDRDFRLTIRTNGTGMPGYKAGWFRMANGGKALAFVGDAHRVLCIPTNAGYTLLLSATQPLDLLEALRSSSGNR